jgi:hypothetical protein
MYFLRGISTINALTHRKPFRLIQKKYCIFHNCSWLGVINKCIKYTLEVSIYNYGTLFTHTTQYTIYPYNTTHYLPIQHSTLFIHTMQVTQRRYTNGVGPQFYQRTKSALFCDEKL